MLEKMADFFENRLDGYDEHMMTNIEAADEFYPFTAKRLPTTENCHKVMWDQQSQCFKTDDKCLVGNTHTVCHLTELDLVFRGKDLPAIDGQSFFALVFFHNLFQYEARH